MFARLMGDIEFVEMIRRAVQKKYQPQPEPTAMQVLLHHGNLAWKPALIESSPIAVDFDAYRVYPESKRLEWAFLLWCLAQPKPSEHFTALHEDGSLKGWIPELDRLWGVPQRPEFHPEVDTGIHAMMVLDVAARMNVSLPVRFACLTHDFGKGTTPAEILPRHHGHEDRSVELLDEFVERFPVPKNYYELAQLVAKEHGNLHRSADLDASATLRLLMRCNAFDNPGMFVATICAATCDARGRLGKENDPYNEGIRLLNCSVAAETVDAKQVMIAEAFLGRDSQQQEAAVFKARRDAILRMEQNHA